MSINVNTAITTAIESNFRGGIGKLNFACIDATYANFVGELGTFFRMDYTNGSYGKWEDTPFGRNNIVCETTDFTNIYMGGVGGFAIFDITQGTFGNLIALPNGGNVKAIGVGGGNVYCSTRNSGQSHDDYLYIYNIAGGTFTSIQNPVEQAKIVWIGYINNLLYLVSDRNGIYVYSGTTKVGQSQSVSGQRGYTATADSSYIYVAYQGDTNSIAKFDMSDISATPTVVQVSTAVNCLFVDGTTLFGGSGTSVYTYDTDTMTTTGTILLTNATSEENLIVLSGGGGMVFMVTDLAVHVYVVAASDFYGRFAIPFGTLYSGAGDIFALKETNNSLFAVGSFGYWEKNDLQSGSVGFDYFSGDNGVENANADLVDVEYDSATGKFVAGENRTAVGIVEDLDTATFTRFAGNGNIATAFERINSTVYFATSGLSSGCTIFKLDLTQAISGGTNPAQIMTESPIFAGGGNIICSTLMDNIVYFGMDDGNLVLLDTTSDTVTTITTGFSDSINALAGHNGELYMGMSSGKFYVYNPTSQSLVGDVDNPFTGAICSLTTDGSSVFAGGENLEFAVYTIISGSFGNLIDINTDIFDIADTSEYAVKALCSTDDMVYGAGTAGIMFSFGYVDTVTVGRYNNFVNEWKDGNTYEVENTYGNDYVAFGELPYGVADTKFRTDGYRFTVKIARSSVESSSTLPSGYIAKVTNLSQEGQYVYYTKENFQSDGSFIVQVAPTQETIGTQLEVMIAWKISGYEVQESDYTVYTFDLSNLSFAEIPADTIVTGTYNDSTGEWSNIASYSIAEQDGVYYASGTVPYGGASVLFPTAGYRLAIKINRNTITNRNELPNGNILMVTDTSEAGTYKYYDRSVFENDGSMIIVFAPTEETLDVLREVKIAWTTWGSTPIASDYTTYTLDFSNATLEALPSDLVAEVTVGYPITQRITSDKIVKVLVPEGGLYAGQFVNCVSIAPVVGGVSNNLEVYTATMPTTATLDSKFIALVINGGLETLKDGRRPDGQPDYTRYKYIAGDVAPAIIVDKNICFEVGSGVVTGGDALNIRNDIGKYIIPKNGSYNGSVANSATQGNCLKIIGTHNFPVGGQSGAGFVPTYVCRAE